MVKYKFYFISPNTKKCTNTTLEYGEAEVKEGTTIVDFLQNPVALANQIDLKNGIKITKLPILGVIAGGKVS